MVRAFAITALLALPACSTPQQAGCTVENCKAALEGCRVEIGGGPSSLAVVTCTVNDKPTAPIEWSKYCVDACLQQGAGVLIACIGSKADACRDGGVANVFKTIDACLDKTQKGPEKACDDTCAAARVECDGKCGIHRACDTCLRAGGNCNDLCPDAGHLACLDCSAACGNRYVSCANFCPRVQ